MALSKTVQSSSIAVAFKTGQNQPAFFYGRYFDIFLGHSSITQGKYKKIGKGKNNLNWITTILLHKWTTVTLNFLSHLFR